MMRSPYLNAVLFSISLMIGAEFVASAADPVQNVGEAVVFPEEESQRGIGANRREKGDGQGNSLSPKVNLLPNASFEEKKEEGVVDEANNMPGKRKYDKVALIPSPLLPIK